MKMNGGVTEKVVHNHNDDTMKIYKKIQNFTPGSLNDSSSDDTSQPSPKVLKSGDDSNYLTNPCEVSINNLLRNNKKPVIKVYGNDVKVKSPFQLGNVYSLCYINNMPLLTIGPEFKTAGLFFLAINASFSSMVIYTFNKIHVMFRVLGILIYVVQFCSHLLSLLMNPGIPNKKNYITDEVIQVIARNIDSNKELLKNYRKCEHCNILVQTKNNVGHCEICNICIEGQDKHSKILGKCIGKNNSLVFHIFVTSSLLLILYSVLICVVYAVSITNGF